MEFLNDYYWQHLKILTIKLSFCVSSALLDFAKDKMINQSLGHWIKSELRKSKENRLGEGSIRHF